MDGVKHKLGRFFSSERARSDVNFLPSAAGRQSNRLRRRLTANSGFTLVEMIVSVALFAVVMLVSVSTLLSLVSANRKAQALQSVINNLSIALDSIARSARMGSNYDGSVECGGNVGGPKDCTEGGKVLTFRPFGNTSSDPPWVYVFDSEAHTLKKSVTGSIVGALPITSPEVTIDDLKFYVVGTTPGDFVQPKIIIIVKGSAGAVGSAARTTFHVQATAVQRVLDL